MKLHNLLLKPFGTEIERTSRLRRYREPIISAVADVLRKRGISTVLDVGANLGQFAHKLRAFGYSGRILSFEPVPQCYACLARETAGDEKWTAFNLAIGDHDGVAAINVMNKTDMCSVREPSDYSLENPNGYQFSVVEKIEVPMRRLDRWLRENEPALGEEEPLFLKTDTQGYDLEVFQGAQGIHSRLTGLLAEVSVSPLYKGVCDWMQMLSQFRAAGFEPAEFKTIGRDERSDIIVEFDCLMVRPMA
jgi:FkbM family methyltransferase